MFGQPQLAVYNDFSLTSKRNFKNLSPTLLETYNELFLDEREELREDCELLMYNFLKIQCDILTSKEGIQYTKFIELLENVITSGDSLLIKIINDFVNENYALSLDEITQNSKDKKRKINEELQFSDAHAKDLLKIAYLYRVLIPIISEYFTYNKNFFSNVKPQMLYDVEEGVDPADLEELQFEEVNSTIFNYLFDKFATNPEALRNKLYRLTYSGVSKTTYSDKRFWLIAKNSAITEKSEALEIYKKLLTNAIPKLSIDGNKNVVSFLQSVINNQVDFLFQNKFKYHFTPIGNTNTNYSTEDNDDSNMTEFERMEIQQSRKDEGEYLIRKLNIQQALKIIPEKMNVGVSDAEVKAMMQHVNRNSIQETIIAILTFKYFNDKEALKFVSFYQYCYLLIACKKFLLQQKYVYLPQILTANCEKHRERTNISGKKVKPEILRSKKYTDLIKERYPNFSEEVEKPFMGFISTVYASVFKDDDGNEIFDSSVKVQKIADELIGIAKLI